MEVIWGLTLVDLITLGVSLLAIIISVWDRILNNINNKKTDKKAEKALRLSQGITEIEIRNSISQARRRVDDFSLVLQKFQLENPNAGLGTHKKSFYSILEDFFNQYDRGCMLYLDDKIDKKRFKAEYKNEIQNIVEDGKYKKRYFNKKNPRFTSIIAVYNKWIVDK